ncbi:MAG: hypothetical protein AAGE89_01155 [Pseudomonadota bacterium]
MADAGVSTIQVLIGITGFIGLAVASWPYVARIKPDNEPMIGSYFVFLSVLFIGAAVVFAVSVGLITSLGLGAYMANWLSQLVLLAIVFTPAFYAAKLAVRIPMTERDLPE